METLTAIECFPCPKCGAEIGEQCRRKNNPERHLHHVQTHVARIKKIDEAVKESEAAKPPAFALPEKYRHTVKIALRVLLERCRQFNNPKGEKLVRDAQREFGLEETAAEN